MSAKRAVSAALALLLVAAIPARAASVPTITVVDSIRTGPNSSSAMDLTDSVALGDYLYFQANDGTHGAELWRTNGTTTTLVKDINTNGTGGADSSYPDQLTAFGDYVYFRAVDGTINYELWRSNGTITELVKDINTTIETVGAGNASPYGLTVLGSYLYFAADDGLHGQELWRTNGTITDLVKDINTRYSGTAGSNLAQLTAFGDYIYFQADDGTHGIELWHTNGTDAGTTIVKDINTNGTDGADNSYPDKFTALGDYLYFQANDGAHGYELWRTNGTAEGTTLVKDINETGADGANGSDPYGFTPLNGYLYFNANDGTHGNELWRTNGSTTTLVKDINTSIGTDGDSSSPEGFAALSGYLYFNAYEPTNGRELWRTDGTDAGTTMVKDINTNGIGGVDASYPSRPTALGNYLYFNAADGTHGWELWRTDGAVTERVPFPVAGQNTNCDCSDTNIVAVGGRLYTTVYSSDIGHEFAYLDEPTAVLPETNRGASVWTVTLVILAGLTAAASIGLRVRGARRA